MYNHMMLVHVGICRYMYHKSTDFYNIVLSLYQSLYTREANTLLHSTLAYIVAWPINRATKKFSCCCLLQSSCCSWRSSSCCCISYSWRKLLSGTKKLILHSLFLTHKSRVGRLSILFYCRRSQRPVGQLPIVRHLIYASENRCGKWTWHNW